MVTGVTYTAASQAKAISLGAGDSDNYGYDPNTGRMSNWTFTVGSTPTSQTGTLTWNPNGTLQNLVIGDGFNTGSTGGSQTCKFGDPSASVPGYDDLGRLVRADCGSAWLQTFSYDQYDNISKTGSSSWTPGYNPATNHALGITYDNNGNIRNDTFHIYAWYVDNKLASTDSTTCGIFGNTDGTCIVYDAFGREVERGVNGTYTGVMYTPVGKTAITSINTHTGGFTTLSAYFPLPGGATYYQTGSSNGSGYFWHKDWLGSVRLSSSVLNRTYYFDRAFAPYGEMYKNFGNTGGLNFTGDTQDSFTGLFDTPNRELHPGEGRWLSPDPAGLGAVDPSNPQTWNRYAYVANNPLNALDPSGLDPCVPGAPNYENDCRPSVQPNGNWQDLVLEGWSFNGTWDINVVCGSLGLCDPSAKSSGKTVEASNKAANNCVNPNAAQRVLIKGLSAVANWTNKTVGVGFGASYGLGFGQGFGFAGTGSAQLQVSPGGSASLVYTWGGSGLTQDWLTRSSLGASFVLGPQVSVSSGPPSPGPGADVAVSGVIPVRGAVGPGASLDVNGSADGVTGTLTGGVGAGIVSGSAVVTQTAVVPLCTGG